MNTTLSVQVDRAVEHPPQPAASVRRVGLVDRLALHVGLALITWSRRPDSARPSHDQRNARVAREREAERRLRLNVPLR
jgi:hypothetical protein